MDEFRAQQEKLSQDMHTLIEGLRAELNDEFKVVMDSVDLQRDAIAEQRQAIAEQRQAIARQDAAIARQDEAMISHKRVLARQGHLLDQGLAGIEVLFQIHRESIGKIMFTYVEDVHALKADMRQVRAVVKRWRTTRRRPPGSAQGS